MLWLVPKALSKHFTEEQNDPVVLFPGPGFPDPFAMYKVPSKMTFANDYSQFFNIVDRSYEAQASVDKTFSRNVSLGMFRYHCTSLLWKRLGYIAS